MTGGKAGRVGKSSWKREKGNSAREKAAGDRGRGASGERLSERRNGIKRRESRGRYTWEGVPSVEMGRGGE